MNATLSERVILLTGAGHGIGRALALDAAAQGAEVVLLDRDLRALEQTFDAIVAAGGPEPALYPCDLSGATPADYEQLAQTLDKEFGRLDGLVHNAAMRHGLTPIQHYNLEHWYKTLQVNLHAPFLLTHSLLPLLLAAPDGRIIFSLDAEGSAPARAYWGAYAVGKSGLHTLMGVLAEELENSSVRVCAVDTGPVRTSMRLRVWPSPEPTWAEPEAVTAPYLYLLGPEGQHQHACCVDAQNWLPPASA